MFLIVASISPSPFLSAKTTKTNIQEEKHGVYRWGS